MAVVVDFVGRFGNNLFQYSLARIIAERLGYEVIMKRTERNSYVIQANFEDCSPELFVSDLSISGKSYEDPISKYGIDVGEWQRIDLESVLKDNTMRRIELKGYFQRYEYYKPYQSELKKWYTCRPQKFPFKISSNDVLLNFRRGDGFEQWALPLTYYHEALKRMGSFDRVYVLGTGIDNEVVSQFKRFDPVYIDGTIQEHFKFFLEFNRIVLSNSTFAWWGGFLSQASELYAPRSIDNKIFAFTGWQDVDLNLHERRYHELSVSTNKIVDIRTHPSENALFLNFADHTTSRMNINHMDVRRLKMEVGDEGISLFELWHKLRLYRSSIKNH